MVVILAENLPLGAVHKLQGQSTHIDAFQTNIFSRFNDTVI